MAEPNFNKTKSAKVGAGANRPKMPSGFDGEVELEAFKYLEKVRATGRPAYVVEFTCCEESGERGESTWVPAGFKSSQFIDEDGDDMWASKVRTLAAAIANVTGSDPVTDDTAPAASAALFAGDGRSTSGIRLRLVTLPYKSKAGRESTIYTWPQAEGLPVGGDDEVPFDI